MIATAGELRVNAFDTTPATASVLVAAGVTKRFGKTDALVDVSLSLRRGAIAALIGPNGAGKSTLIKCFLGFERPTRGTVSIGGHDPIASMGTVLRDLGYLAQGAPTYEDLTVSDHLRLAKGLRPSFDLADAYDRLHHLGIQIAKRAGRLSGGEQAQVALAIVLATHPSVLILDEPLASLDPLARREFLDLLVDTAHRNRQTVLLSSHIVSDIEHACDELIILAAGRVLLSGSVTRALDEHAVGPVGAVTDLPIARVPSRAAAAEEALYRVPPAPSAVLRRPTLEELVLGYLASARDGRTS